MMGIHADEMRRHVESLSTSVEAVAYNALAPDAENAHRFVGMLRTLDTLVDEIGLAGSSKPAAVSDESLPMLGGITPTNVCALIRAEARKLEPLALAYGIEYTVTQPKHAGTGLENAFADRARLAGAVHTLVLDAIRNAAPGSALYAHCGGTCGELALDVFPGDRGLEETAALGRRGHGMELGWLKRFLETGGRIAERGESAAGTTFLAGLPGIVLASPDPLWGTGRREAA